MYKTIMNAKHKTFDLLAVFAAIIKPIYPAVLRTWPNHFNNSHDLLGSMV